MVGERGPGTQPVVGAHAHPAARRQVQHERHGLLVLVADDPAAAVDLQQRRAACRVVLVPVDVEVVPAPVGAVGDVLRALDLAKSHAERDQQTQPRDGRVVAGGQLRVDLGQVLLPQALLQGSLGDLARAPRDGDEVERAGDRHRHEHDGHHALPTMQPAEQRESYEDADLDEQAVDGELGGQPPPEERQDRHDRPGHGPDGVDGGDQAGYGDGEEHPLHGISFFPASTGGPLSPFWRRRRRPPPS